MGDLRLEWATPLPVDGNAARPLSLVTPAVAPKEDRVVVNPMGMTYTEEGRYRRLAYETAKKAIERLIREEAFKKYQGSQWRSFRDKLERVFEGVLAKNSDKLIKAAKVKPSASEALKKVAETKKESRRQLAAELRESRNKLRDMKKNMEDIYSKAKEDAERQFLEEKKWLKETLAQMRGEIKEAAKELADLRYRNLERFQTEFSIVIPRPTDAKIAAPEAETRLPKTPGVYFVWDPNLRMWAYVGKSVSLASRCKLGSHHIISDHHKIAFLEVDRDELDYAEIVYIALLRPFLNFGGKLNNNGGKPWAKTIPIREGE